MPAASIEGDISSGHDCYPPRPTSVTGSPNVFIESKKAWRVTDWFDIHCCVLDGDADNDGLCHDGAVVSGSGVVFINGLAAARMGDPIDCGDNIAGPCSSIVFIGS